MRRTRTTPAAETRRIGESHSPWPGVAFGRGGQVHDVLFQDGPSSSSTSSAGACWPRSSVGLCSDRTGVKDTSLVRHGGSGGGTPTGACKWPPGAAAREQRLGGVPGWTGQGKQKSGAALKGLAHGWRLNG